MRASSGVSTLFRFTGEQFDAETGFTYLRARYLSTALGRFISADSVQPNAPGTQGWNLYAYVANNPTTWVDPSGHTLVQAAMAAPFFANPTLITVFVLTCAAGDLAVIALGLQFGFCITAVWKLLAVLLPCALDSECMTPAWDYAQKVAEFGWNTLEGVGEWIAEELQNAVDSWPAIPDVTTLFSGRSLDDVLNNPELLDQWLKRSFPAEQPYSKDDADKIWEALEDAELVPKHHKGHPNTKWDIPHIHVEGKNVHIPVEDDFVPPPE